MYIYIPHQIDSLFIMRETFTLHQRAFVLKKKPYDHNINI